MANDDDREKGKETGVTRKPTEHDRGYHKGEKEEDKRDKTLTEDDDTNRGSLRSWPGNRGRSKG